MKHLPTGTVTFLFSDIEGSTKLWEQNPEAMQFALARHDVLMRNAIESSRGVVFKTVGDAFCAAFPSAPDALTAAIEAQLSLHKEVWPDGILIRVRMALHTGVAQERDNDYFGPILNRVARLLSAGHGGQVLLSNIAHDLCRDTLPPAVSLWNLGDHRLKDLNRSETVYQLGHPCLTEKFPPLRSLDYAPNNLPRQLTSFIGREKQIAEVISLLEKTGLLTLTGSGGSGKTRLALQVGADALDEYPDGVWLVELASVIDGTLVQQIVASVLGVKEHLRQNLQQSLTEHLKTKRLLILLDNCEHLLPDCAKLSAFLLRSCPHVRILVTSREPLGIAGELVYRVPSLSLPTPEQFNVVSIHNMNQYEAVQLFIERATLVKPDLVMTNMYAPTLVQLCHRLDGIPLAIELAAARLRSLTVEDINNRLDSRFRLLTGGDRSALPRHQTPRALIDWSYDLLNEQERLHLARLSVFAGGWSLAAAEAVCAFESIQEWNVLDLLTSLVDKSLVLPSEAGRTIQYRMLETVRQYAVEKREVSEETKLLHQRHLNYFLNFAEEAEPFLVGTEQAEWLDRLETNHDNLRVALDWCEAEVKAGATKYKEVLLRLSGALWRFWEIRGHFAEGRGRLEKALQLAQSRTAASAKVFNGAGILAANQGDFMVAKSLYEDSLSIRRELGDKHGIAYSINSLGSIASNQGDFAVAQSLLQESLAIFHELGDKRGIAYSLNSLGSVAAGQSNYVLARSLYEESLSIRRELGDKRSASYSLNSLAGVAYNQADFVSARTLYEESLSIRRELGDKRGIAHSLNSLAVVAYNDEDFESARLLLRESLDIFKSLGDLQGVAATLNNLGDIDFEKADYESARLRYEQSLDAFWRLDAKSNSLYSLEGLAKVATRESATRKAVILWAATTALRESLGVSVLPNDHTNYDQQVERGHMILGDQGFLIAWEKGRTLTWEQAVAYALGEMTLTGDD